MRCVIVSDWVIDLQFVPQSLDDVGELCGFNGAGHLCHKGVLARCKWMYNDIKRRDIMASVRILFLDCLFI